MKKIVCALIILLALGMLISCEEVIDLPSTDNCFNIRCEITMNNESFTVYGDDARDIYSICNQYMNDATLSSTAIPSGSPIKIKVMGDKRENPKSSSDTVVFYTYSIYSNNVVEYSGSFDYTYIYPDGFYNTIDTMIFFIK